MDETKELSPAQTVLLCYERLILDLETAQARWEQDRSGAVKAARHAQEIVLALRRAIQSGGELRDRLRSLYGAIHDRLESICATGQNGPQTLTVCIDGMRKLADSWREKTKEEKHE